MKVFWLGVHRVWLHKLDVPLFLSRRLLEKRRSLPRALGPWALDSGAFYELPKYGRWTLTARQYAEQVRRFRDEAGRLAWASIQDWMCEPFVLKATGLTVRDHQRKTIESYEDLLSIAPDLPWVPVLQGYEVDDYVRHLEQYRKRTLPLKGLIGVGSVCRRQATLEAVAIVSRLRVEGAERLHGFGVKIKGFPLLAGLLESADSMSWSRQGRWARSHPGCSCTSAANCPRYALQWRARLLRSLGLRG